MNYLFIGWCKEDDHDKVWGMIEISKPERWYNTPDKAIPGKYCSFWGRRGKKLQTKLIETHHPSSDVTALIRKKEDKGYKAVDMDKLNEVYPAFERDLDKTAVMAILRS